MYRFDILKEEVEKIWANVSKIQDHSQFNGICIKRPDI